MPSKRRSLFHTAIALTWMLNTSGCSDQTITGAVDAGSDATDPDATADAKDGNAPRYPLLLSQTGLYANLESHSLASDVLEYQVRFPLWSDSSEKHRYIRLPAGAKLDARNETHFVYPVGTQIWKEFRLAGKRLEMRYLQKLSEGNAGWISVSYLFRDDELEADAQPLGLLNVRGTTHDVPSQNDCLSCHLPRAFDSRVGSLEPRDLPIGLDFVQLSENDLTPNEGLLAQLEARGQLLGNRSNFVPPGESNESNVLGYLHGNCGYCHNENGPVENLRSVRFRLRSSDRSVLETDALRTTVQQTMHHEIGGTSLGLVPGDAARSQVYNRVNRRDIYAMPPLGTESIDVDSVRALELFIEGMNP